MGPGHPSEKKGRAPLTLILLSATETRRGLSKVQNRLMSIRFQPSFLFPAHDISKSIRFWLTEPHFLINYFGLQMEFRVHLGKRVPARE